MTARTADKIKRLLADTRAWLRLRDPQTGHIVGYGVPSESTPGLYHRVNHKLGCDCRSYRERGWCSHHRAVVAYVAARHAEGTAAPAAASLPVTVTVTVAAVTATVNDDLFPGTEPVAADAPVAIPPVTPTGRNRFFPTLQTPAEREWRLTGRHTA